MRVGELEVGQDRRKEEGCRLAGGTYSKVDTNSNNMVSDFHFKIYCAVDCRWFYGRFKVNQICFCHNFCRSEYQIFRTMHNKSLKGLAMKTTMVSCLRLFV